jgi:acyl-CoA synthetase (AMP-forming)/AMP-acid ligase II
LSGSTVELLLAGKQAVGIVARNSVDYVRRVYQALEAGCVVVPLRSAQDSERSAVFNLRRTEDPDQESGWLQLGGPLPSGADPAFVAFSSGTEGQPKAILLTHDNLADVVTRLNQAMQVDAGIREYVGVPVFHSFGFGRCRAAMAAGGAVYIPPRGFNPREIGEMLRSGEVNALSVVPTLCRVLLESRHLIGDAGSKLRWMEIGSQYMSREEKEQIRSLFPSAIIVQHYGLTEASRSTFLEVHSASGDVLESVGTATGQVQIRIESDGRIAINGPHVARFMVVAGDVTDPLGPDGWLTTNDLGELKNGVLHFRGRADDVINCGGLKLYPELLERQIRERLGTADGIAVCRVPDPMRGDGVLVAYLAGRGLSYATVLDAAQLAVVAGGLNATGSVHCMETTSFPVTDNGKLKRRDLAAALGPTALAQTAQAAEQFTTTAASEAPSDGTAVSRIFADCFPGKRISPEDSFVSLGGDSLTYVSLVLALEEVLPQLPDTWERLSVSELSRLEAAKGASEGSSMVELEATVLIRAVAPVLVVMNHAGETWLAGGAAMLLAAVGMNFGRFQLKHVLEGRTRQVLSGFAINVLIPYWLILIAFQAWKGDIRVADVLLFGNFVGTKTSAPFAVWFVQVVAQLLLILALLSRFPGIRSIAAKDTYRFAAGMLAVASAVRLAEPLLFPSLMVNGGRELAWVAWLFALGLMIFASRTPVQRGVSSVCAVALSLTFYWGDASRITLITLGCLFALWAPRVSLPRFSSRTVGMLASASMFIYMMHGRVPLPTMTAQWPMDVVRIGLGVVLGVATWWGYSALVRFVQARRSPAGGAT